MDELFTTIRSAIATDASPEARAAGAQACRTILAALEGTPGQPLVTPPTPSSPMQAVLAALSNTPPEQLLDLAIAKLRSLVPADSQPQTIQSLRIPLVPVIPQRGGS
jgi:hypothetical protein